MKNNNKSNIITVRGVSMEASNALKICSKRDNKTQGQWLDYVILNAAKTSSMKKKDIAKPEDVSDIIQKMYDKISDFQKMSDKIDELSDRVNKPWYKRIV